METVKGLKKLLDVLEKIPKELDGDVGAILEGNAQEIELEAKRLAPVDTGKLRQSIKTESISPTTYSIKANATGLAPYAPFVEFGTRKMGAQPFLYPAFFRGRDKFTEDLEDLLDDTFKKI